MPSLFIKQGPNQGSMIELHGRRLWVGRGEANDIDLDNRTVSRQHAIIVRRGNQWHLQDADSQNGVLVNGERVRNADLRNGDEIRLGSVALVYIDEGRREAPLPVSSGGRPAEVTQVIPMADIQDQVVGIGRRNKGKAMLDSRLSHLLRLSEVAASVKSIPALFEAIVQSLQIAMPADLVLPFLLGPDQMLRPFIPQRGDFVDSSTSLGIDRKLLERCLEEGAVAAFRPQDAGTSIACIPIRPGSRNLGLIYCERHGGNGAFTDEDLRYLVTVGMGAGLVISNLRAYERIARKTHSLSRQIEQQFNMVGESEPMQRVFQTIRKVAPADAGVLITGESGTGKEMVARAVHKHSKQSEGPFEIVNCAAVPETLMESELFGHVRGAFTGAVADKPGRFELADGGTLFLDEVGDLSIECQAKLLRVLEEKTVRRVGDTRDRPVEVRLVAATNQDLRKAQERGHFRSDLFFRLDRLRINLPPLRKREGDIRLLARHSLESFSRQVKQTVEDFAPEVLEAFEAYHWPGNVRELRNTIERMVILAEGEVLGPELLPENLRDAAGGTGPRAAKSLEEVEKEHIERVLKATGGNKSQAAEILGIDRSTLYARLDRYDLDS